MERNSNILAFTILFLLGWFTGVMVAVIPQEDRARAQIERLSGAITEREDRIVKLEASLRAANARVLVENARAKDAQEKLALILMDRRGRCQDR